MILKSSVFYPKFPPLLLVIFLPLITAGQDLNSKLHRAEKVFEGKVVAQKRFWNSSRTRSFICNTVEVSRVFKGDVPPEINVVLHGASPPEASVYMVPGSEGVFFCKYFENSDHPADRFLMLNGSSGFIRYDFEKNGRHASSPTAVYPRYRRHVLKPLEKAAKQRVLIYRKNGFETIVTRALDEYRKDSLPIRPAVWLEKENRTTIGQDRVAFDIFVRSNTQNQAILEATIIIQYPTNLFGDSLAYRERLNVRPGALLADSFYSFWLEDLSPNHLKLVIKATKKRRKLLSIISPLPEQLAHLEFEIANIEAFQGFTYKGIAFTGSIRFFDTKSRFVSQVELMPADY